MFITEKLIYALIIPKLNNANILLYGLTKFLIDRLKNVQNATTRVLIRTKKYERIKPVLKQLHWLPVINYKILLPTYKTVNAQAPRRTQGVGNLEMDNSL